MPVLQPIAAMWADIGLVFGATADLKRKIVMKVTAVTVVMCLRPLAKKRAAPAFIRVDSVQAKRPSQNLRKYFAELCNSNPGFSIRCIICPDDEGW